MSTTDTTTVPALTGERADLVEALDRHRYFLRFTVQGLGDDAANQRTTASELTLAKLIKHVTATESQWVDFIEGGAEGMTRNVTPDSWQEAWTVRPGETLDLLLERYDEVARRTDELVATIPDLDAAHDLPQAPWFQPGARWSARRALLHIIAETSQHAGHADIIRESLDGQKTMG